MWEGGGLFLVLEAQTTAVALRPGHEPLTRSAPEAPADPGDPPEVPPGRRREHKVRLCFAVITKKSHE